MSVDNFFANKVCQDYVYWEIVTFMIEVALIIIIIISCIRVLIEMGDNKMKSMRSLHLTLMLFYCSSIICCLLYLNNHCIYCFTENYSSISDISWIVAIISFVIHWGTILLAFFFRLYFIFSTTAYEISKLFICLFFTLFFIVGICALLPTIYFDYIYQENHLYSLTSGGLLLLFVVIFHILLSIMFIYKLFQVTQSIERHDSSHNLQQLSPTNGDDDTNNGNGDDNDIPYESKIVSMIRKYTILSIISSIGASLLLITFLICIGIGQIDNFFDNVLMIFYILNVLINMICISLSLSLYNNVYVRFCQNVDNLCKNCCNNLAQYYINNGNKNRWSALQSEQLSDSDDPDQEPVDL